MGRLVAAAQLEGEGDGDIEEGRAGDGAVQDVAGEGAVDARGGGQSARDYGAGVDAAGPVGGLAGGIEASRPRRSEERCPSDQSLSVRPAVPAPRTALGRRRC